MKSIKKVRLASISIAGLLSSFFQNMISSFVEDFFNGLDPAFLYFAKSFLSLAVLLITYFIIANLMKSTWIRKSIFKEKIIDGTWFGCLYDTAQKSHEKVYVVAKTYFNEEKMDVVFSGDLFSLDGRTQVGSFSCLCANSTMESQSNVMSLYFAHQFEFQGDSKGFGEIKISFSNTRISEQEGRFILNDGRVYHYRAMVVDKKHEKNLFRFRDERVDKILELYKEYKKINEKINVTYNDKLYLDPEYYHKFAQKEDYQGNLKSNIRTNDFRNKIVLDLGSGTGRFAEYVLPDVAKIICTDYSSDMLAYAQNLDFFTKNKDKVEFVHSDHMSLYSLLADKYEGKIDYIIAGYSIGAFYNDSSHSEKQSNKWLTELIEKLKKLLTPCGKIIIVENIGIGIIGENLRMTENDWKLRSCYACLENMGFNKTELQTSFRFDDNQEAKDIINIVWTDTEYSQCREKEGKWYLDSASAIWTWSKMKHSVIFCDIDDTLLDDNLCLSENNTESILNYVSNGGKFILVSGRNFSSFKNLYETLKLDTYVVLNFGVIYDPTQNEILFDNTIDKNMLLEICKHLEQRNIYYQICYKDKIYVKTKTEYSKKYIDRCNVSITETNMELSDFILQNDISIHKLAFECDTDKIDVIANIFQDSFGDNLSIIKSKSWVVEIFSKKAQKGNAVKKVIELLGVSKNETMAIGDSLSDLSMFSEVEFSVAVDNSSDVVKEKSNAITSSNNQNGVAKAIEKYAYFE